jgi:hypothetical protein
VSSPRRGWLRAYAFLLAALCLVGSACGGGHPTSEGNSDDIARELRREHRDERRLDALERRIARLRQRESRQRPSQGPDSNVPGSSGLASTVGGLAGEVGVADGDLRGRNVQAAGDLSTGSAWSTIKVPIALALLREVGGPSNLTSAQASQIEAAITLSDNAAAAALFAELEGRHGGVGGRRRHRHASPESSWRQFDRGVHARTKWLLALWPNRLVARKSTAFRRFTRKWLPGRPGVDKSPARTDGASYLRSMGPGLGRSTGPLEGGLGPRHRRPLPSAADGHHPAPRSADSNRHRCARCRWPVPLGPGLGVPARPASSSIKPS